MSTPIEVGNYEHTKSGKQYNVIGTALHTETEEVMVVYRPLYESKIPLFVRPESMFAETIELHGQSVPRFKKLPS